MPSSRNRTRIWLMAVLAPGLLLRMVMAFRDVNELTLRVLPDDAFYYFVIARNIAAGHGSTFDQLAPTNGYHPLWMALITPLFALLPGRQAPVTGALILSSLIAAATAWLVYLVLRRLGQPRAVGVAGAAAWFYSPMSIQFSLNGLETAVATAAALLLFLQHLRMRSLDAGGGIRLTVTNGALVGLAAGLALLARTDLVFLVAPVGLVFAWHALRAHRWGAALAAALLLVLTVAPWFAWNWHTFGSLTQVSGKALPTWEYRAFAHAHPNTGLMDTAYRDEWLRRLHAESGAWGVHTGFSPVSWRTWPGGARLPWRVAGLAAVLAVGGAAVRARGRTVRALCRLWPYGVLLVALFVVHPLMRWSSREWYAGVPAVGVFLAFFVMLGGAACRLAGRRAGTIVVSAISTLLVGAYLVQFAGIQREGFYKGQKGFLDTLRMTERRLPDTSLRFASTDCGHTAYMGHLRTVNLDGLVNNQAYLAIKQGRLADYLIGAGIDVFQIRQSYLHDHFMGAGWQKRFAECAGVWSPVRTPFTGPDVLATHRTDETSAPAVFASGWHRPGTGHGIWNDGTTASLMLALPPDIDGGTSGTTVTLALYGMSYPFHDTPLQTATITAGGVVVARDVALPPYLTVVRVDLPPGLPPGGTTATEFVLHFPHARRLTEFNPASTDNRRLAYNIWDVALLRTAGAP